MQNELLKLYVHEFTARKQTVIYWVSEGLSNDEVGEKLFLTPQSVADHLTEIYGLMATLPSLLTYKRIGRSVAVHVFSIFFHENPELKPPCD